MPSEPLDPCPVCGGALQQTEDETLIECCTVCPYTVPIGYHRRLCAEVALARVVMEQDTRRQPEFVKHAGPFDADRGARLIEAAIARVRREYKDE